MKNTTFENSSTIVNQQETTTDNKLNSSKLIEREQLEGTPFTLIKQEGKYFITIGNYQLTPQSDTEEEAINYIQFNQWNIITALIDIMINHYNNKKS